MQVIQAAVRPIGDVVARLTVDAVVAEGSELSGEAVVVSSDHAGVAIGADHLEGVEAEASGDPHRAQSAAVEGGPRGLGHVLDHGQTVGLGDGQDPVHLAGRAVQVHGDHRSGPRRDGGLEQVRVHVAVIADIDQDRLPARVDDGAYRGHAGVGDGDDLIARIELDGTEGQIQGIVAAADTYGVPGADELSEALLELLNLLPQDDLSL